MSDEEARRLSMERDAYIGRTLRQFSIEEIIDQHDVLRKTLDALVSDHDGQPAVWVCDTCGQPIGKDGRCSSGAHVGPDDVDFGPNSGHAVATTDLVAGHYSAILDQRLFSERLETMREEFTVLIDACGHCMAAGRAPSERMIEAARATLMSLG